MVVSAEYMCVCVACVCVYDVYVCMCVCMCVCVGKLCKKQEQHDGSLSIGCPLACIMLFLCSSVRPPAVSAAPAFLRREVPRSALVADPKNMRACVVGECSEALARPSRGWIQSYTPYAFAPVVNEPHLIRACNTQPSDRRSQVDKNFLVLGGFGACVRSILPRTMSVDVFTG